MLEEIDPALADAFWDYFTNESIHDFMEPGGTDAMNALFKQEEMQERMLANYVNGCGYR